MNDQCKGVGLVLPTNTLVSLRQMLDLGRRSYIREFLRALSTSKEEPGE
jgi:hypothetical protein